MRLWLDPDKLASYQLTAGDVEAARESCVLDLEASVLHDVETGVARRRRGTCVFQPELEPDRLRVRGDRRL